MRHEIRTSTSSMTSVPKPLKFLHPHYGTLKAFYETMPESDLKESLKYRLLGLEGDIGSWGHEYVRNLAGEIAQEYGKRQSEEAAIEDLLELVQQIVSFHMNRMEKCSVITTSYLQLICVTFISLQSSYR
ncbi:hypothetical protein E1A91_A08G162000v1 [Gossypium mustelinum]|uniref:RPN1 N-terminal domain-containing protein n=2 Tax=Gossypium TaxID=3633 RepID=A0A5D2YA68_GOSMU|nr:hypothetical protein ES288_A08G171200v1 [Gossypium darwinii]TYJ23003.1 hypothetical protein E1A91_A08G162000v1 [Gossypium mustelinum]